MLFLQDEDYNLCLLGRISSNCMVRVTMCFSNTFSHPELIYVILVSLQWGKTRFRWRSLWLVKLPRWWWSYLGCGNSKDMFLFTPKRLGKKDESPHLTCKYIFFLLQMDWWDTTNSLQFSANLQIINPTTWENYGDGRIFCEAKNPRSWNAFDRRQFERKFLDNEF